MNRRIVVVAVAVAVLPAVAACGGGGSRGDALPPPPSAAASTPPAFLPPVTRTPGVTAPPATRSAALGSRLTLMRRDGTSTVDVNALEVADPATGRSAPPAGTRWVAIHVEISNPGGPTYTEVPADAFRLIDTDGNAYAAWKSEPVRPGLGDDSTVRAGGFVRGFVAFSVPLAATPAAFRFTPEKRTAPDTGEWRLS